MAGDLTPQGCLLCGESRHETVFRYRTPDRYERTVGIGDAGYLREWVACNGCHVHYSRYSRDADVLDRLYDDAYRDSAASWRSQSAEEIFQRVVALPADESETVARCAYIKSILARFEACGIHRMPNGRSFHLLDVGGATGVFAYLFKDDHWQVEIVDPSAQGKFVERYGVRYHQRRFDADFPGGPYELVSMLYMLEHVRNPRGVLEQARKVLGDGGLIYIEVPDQIAFEKKPAEDDIFNSCHLWMFGPNSLTRLLGFCGFEPLEVRRIKAHRGHYALTILARPV